MSCSQNPIWSLLVAKESPMHHVDNYELCGNVFVGDSKKIRNPRLLGFGIVFNVREGSLIDRKVIVAITSL